MKIILTEANNGLGDADKITDGSENNNNPTDYNYHYHQHSQVNHIYSNLPQPQYSHDHQQMVVESNYISGNRVDTEHQAECFGELNHEMLMNRLDKGGEHHHSKPSYVRQLDFFDYSHEM